MLLSIFGNRPITMCGIAGFAGKGSKEILEKMTSSLRHRGPDDAGFFFVPQVVGFGFRRLAIIDLATGNQPIFNEDKTIAVILNGEIYNFQELRKKLLPRHTFTTQGDTEVIIHLYEEYGEQLFEKLNGMFAIAIWDSKQKKLILARDRFGKKPLYYTIANNTLIFGSEIKALLKHPLVKKDLDIEALNLYLTHEYIPMPRSIFKNISKLEAGRFAVFQKGEIRCTPYYNLTLHSREVPHSLNETLVEFDNLLRDAVKLRLISDVPLGIFLSGGIDSSTIAYYAQQISNHPVKTFSIGFENASFDESIYARRVAKHLGTEHHERHFGAQQLIDLIPEVTNLLDEPTADSAIFPNFLLSKFARESVTVVVGGDAGDELFYGYPTFQAHRLSPLPLIIPNIIRKHMIRPIIDSLPVSLKPISFDYKLKRFLLGLEHSSNRRDAIWIGAFTPEEKQLLFTHDALSELKQTNDFEAIDRHAADVGGKPLLERSSYIYQKTYLIDNTMMHKDRASMFTSLELRAPFLDYRIVDFVNSLPIHYKLRGLSVKYFLKQLMKDRLPHDILHRRKRGFSLPVAYWLRNELKPLMLDVLSKKNIERDGLFRYQHVELLIHDHLSGRRDNRRLLWSLIMFQLWKKQWMEN